jgi:Holliday junction resolvase-like predicted endonuclease
MADHARKMLKERQRQASAWIAAFLVLAVIALAGLWSGGGLITLAAGAGSLVALGAAIHHADLAERSRIGIRCEDQVTDRLAELERLGWKIRRSVNWQGPGDIDLIATAPTGHGFAIEVKTRRYNPAQLKRTTQQAQWLARRRRRWCPAGCWAVLCPAAQRGLCQWEEGVLVCSPELLAEALRQLANPQGEQ